MRPLRREPPVSGKTSFEPNYRDAKPDLRNNFGDFCCYCEVHSTTLEVEHVLSRNNHKDSIYRWDNLLLVCPECNKKKSDKEFTFRPDRDNTFLVFSYERKIGKERGKAEVVVVPNSQVLTEEQCQQAQTMIDVLGLCRDLNAPKAYKRTPRDAYWDERDKIWEMAEKFKKRLQTAYKTNNQQHIDEIQKDIYDFVVVKGNFSIWMTVFADDPDMRKRFIKAFKGTATDCFDDDGNPIPRPGGKI